MLRNKPSNSKKKPTTTTTLRSKQTRVIKKTRHNISTRSPIPNLQSRDQHHRRVTQFPLITTTLSKRAMSTTQIPTIIQSATIIEPKGEHKKTVFFLHGLGDVGVSFIDMFESLNLSNTKVILPNAPSIPITCNGGYKMPGWYDILEFSSLSRGEDVVGVTKSVDSLIDAINYEKQLVKSDASNIVIGGFSQGASVSMLCAARYPEQLAGVVALSGYALLTQKSEDENKFNTTTTPFFIYHGEQDPVVRIEMARQSKLYYEKRGILNIEYYEEPRLEHSLSRQELVKIKQFLTKIGFE